jgi:SAM-dependent methyltransferase
VLEYSTLRYLLSKQSVDDRSLNRVVLEAFKQSLANLDAGPLRVLELGAGVGTMVSRLADWGVLTRATYTLLDHDAANLVAARRHLQQWGATQPGAQPEGVRELQQLADLFVTRGDAKCQVSFEHSEAFLYLEGPAHEGTFDVVMANAVLDLLDLKPALQSIWRVLKPGGLFWFSINFDGETIFLPEHELDSDIMRLYHRSMDERTRDGKPAGDSKTGRHLLTCLPETGATLTAAGSSDWVVFPTGSGYSGDEAYFLHHIVNTIDEALRQSAALERESFDRWVELRHSQVERGILCYIAHQLDVLGTTASLRQELEPR